MSHAEPTTTKPTDKNINRTNQASNDSIESFFVNENEFRQEVIYFIIVDRFHDGTSDEEERQGQWDRGEKSGLYDKTWLDWGKYWGGNIQGLIDKVDYLQSLGVTAVWLSPLVEQVDDMQFNRAPMHGYWTKDFKRVNPRFIRKDDTNSLGSSRTIKDLVDAYHAAGIKLILDVVCNHSSPDVNGNKGVVYDDGTLLADFNDDTNNFYYHNPEISDWDDEYQLIHGEMMGLATFNDKNIEYRKYIKSAIKTWLDAGFDALRVDTLKHMPIWFWQEFTTDMQAHKPGLFLFGEYGFSKPWDQRSVDYANHSGMSILDFGLSDGIRFAFSGQEPGGFHLVQKVLEMDHVYQRANELVTFIDNHDMPRFLSIAPNPKYLELAVALLLSLRGVPCLFYGTEQYLNNPTDGGNDPYNRPMMENWSTESNLFILIKSLSKIRQENQAFTLGNHQQRYITEAIYGFSRKYRDFSAFVIINKGEEATIRIESTGLPAGQHQCVLTQQQIEVQDDGSAEIHLMAEAAYVFSQMGKKVTADTVGVFQLNGYRTQLGESIAITGNCDELGNWDIDKAYVLEFVNDNTWIGEVPLQSCAGQKICYKFIAIKEQVDSQTKTVVYENILHRWHVVPSQGRVKLDCIWGDD